MNVVVLATGATEQAVLPELVRPFLVGKSYTIESKDIVLARHGRMKPSLKVLIPAHLAAVDCAVVLDDLGLPDPYTTIPAALTAAIGALDTEANRQKHYSGITCDVRCFCAVQQLEAWFYGDLKGLQAFCGSGEPIALPANPGMPSPKSCDDVKLPGYQLERLLNRHGHPVYGAGVALDIAKKLSKERIYENSASFRAFVDGLP